MATPPKSYFPWRRFQRAVGTWAAKSLGFEPTTRAVIWGDFDVQRPALPYLSLQVTSGPNRRAQDPEMWPRLYPSVIDVQVLAAAVTNVGSLANLIVNGELFTHTAIGGDTTTTVRNDLVTKINASVELGATAAPTGASTLRLTAAGPGMLSVEPALAVSATTIATQLVKLNVGAREVRVRATAYGAPEPNAPGQVSVAEWIELLAQGAQDDVLRDELRNQGFVISRSQIMQLRLTAPSGAERELRAAADLMFGCNVRRGVLVNAWLDEVQTVTPQPVNGGSEG